MENQTLSVVEPGNEPRPLDLLTTAMDRINAIYSRALARNDGATRSDCLVAMMVLRSLKKAIP